MHVSNCPSKDISCSVCVLVVISETVMRCGPGYSVDWSTAQLRSRRHCACAGQYFPSVFLLDCERKTRQQQQQGSVHSPQLYTTSDNCCSFTNTLLSGLARSQPLQVGGRWWISR